MVAAATGAAMCARPGDWPPDRFATAFAVLPERWWATGFLVAGLLKAIWLRPWFAALLSAVLWAWCSCALWAICGAYLHGARPPTAPTGWMWIGACSIVMLLPDHGGAR